MENILVAWANRISVGYLPPNTGYYVFDSNEAHVAGCVGPAKTLLFYPSHCETRLDPDQYPIRNVYVVAHGHLDQTAVELIERLRGQGTFLPTPTRITFGARVDTRQGQLDTRVPILESMLRATGLELNLLAYNQYDSHCEWTFECDASFFEDDNTLYYGPSMKEQLAILFKDKSLVSPDQQRFKQHYLSALIRQAYYDRGLKRLDVVVCDRESAQYPTGWISHSIWQSQFKCKEADAVTAALALQALFVEPVFNSTQIAEWLTDSENDIKHRIATWLDQEQSAFLTQPLAKDIIQQGLHPTRSEVSIVNNAEEMTDILRYLEQTTTGHLDLDRDYIVMPGDQYHKPAPDNSNMCLVYRKQLQYGVDPELDVSIKAYIPITIPLDQLHSCIGALFNFEFKGISAICALVNHCDPHTITLYLGMYTAPLPQAAQHIEHYCQNVKVVKHMVKEIIESKYISTSAAGAQNWISEKRMDNNWTLYNFENTFNDTITDLL